MTAGELCLKGAKIVKISPRTCVGAPSRGALSGEVVHGCKTEPVRLPSGSNWGVIRGMSGKLLRLSKRMPRPSISLLFLLGTWLFFVSWRTFSFGFYHDDWSSVALPLDRSSRLIDLLIGDPSRPFYVILLYLLRPLLNPSVELWQLLLALIHLTTAIAIRSTVSLMLSEEDGEDGKLLGSIAGILWLIFPWSLGYSAWTVMLPPNLAMLLSISAFWLVLKPELNLKKVNISILLFAGSWLIYEATWMFWLPISLVLYVRAIERKEPTGCVLQFAIRAAGLQLIFVLWNRFVSSSSLVAKTFSEKFISTIETNIHLMHAQLFQLLIGKEVMGISLVLLLGCVLLNNHRWGKSLSSWAFPFIMCLGLALTVSLYAFAGYAIEWTGLFSRVTLPLSFWFALLFAVIFSLGWRGSAPNIKKVLVVSLVGCLVPLGVSLLKQSVIWKDAWQDQVAIIDALPQSVVDLANSDSLILFDIPRGTAPVHTFSAFWDISGVVTFRMSNYVKPTKTHAYASVVRTGEFRTTWDGSVLRQFWCSSPSVPLWSLNASRLYVWKYPNNEATELVAPFEHGCDI